MSKIEYQAKKKKLPPPNNLADTCLNYLKLEVIDEIISRRPQLVSVSGLCSEAVRLQITEFGGGETGERWLPQPLWKLSQRPLTQASLEP